MPAISRAAILRRITRFENLAVDNAFRGAQHPDDRQLIEERYLAGKERFLRWIIGIALSENS